MSNREEEFKATTEAHAHENCHAIYEAEEDSPVPRASFRGRIQDAPGCATMVANTLSQQSIHEVNVLLAAATGGASNLLVSFDSLNVSLGNAAYPYVQPPALEALGKAIEGAGEDNARQLCLSHASAAAPALQVVESWRWALQV